MRAVLVLGVIACAACNDRLPGESIRYPDPGGGSLCEDDGDCDGGDVCAHTGQCYPTTQLRSVTAKWTIDGEKASGTTCTGLTLLLSFIANGANEITYSPVACAQGQFFIDKMPTVYNQVKLEGASDKYGVVWAQVDANGVAQLALTLM